MIHRLGWTDIECLASIWVSISEGSCAPGENDNRMLYSLGAPLEGVIGLICGVPTRETGSLPSEPGLDDVGDVIAAEEMTGDVCLVRS